MSDSNAQTQTVARAEAGPAGASPAGPASIEIERLRQRAERAEAQAGALDERVESLESQLSQSREALDAAERRRAIDEALAKADAVDLETARLLTEMAVQQMDDADVAAAVADLRRRKPFLFRSGGARGGGATAMSPAARPSGDNASEAAEEAMRTGDRTALLRYLRSRREG